MCRVADSLRHLLLCLNLDVHITGTGLDGTEKLPLRDLHSLDLAALFRYRRVLESRIVLHHISHAACRHERHIRREHLIDSLHRKIAAVKTHLSHLTLLQGRKNALQILIYNSSTNHSYILFHQSHNLIYCKVHNADITYSRRKYEMYLS